MVHAEKIVKEANLLNTYDKMSKKGTRTSCGNKRWTVSKDVDGVVKTYHIISDETETDIIVSSSKEHTVEITKLPRLTKDKIIKEFPIIFAS